MSGPSFVIPSFLFALGQGAGQTADLQQSAAVPDRRSPWIAIARWDPGPAGTSRPHEIRPPGPTCRRAHRFRHALTDVATSMPPPDGGSLCFRTSRPRPEDPAGAAGPSSSAGALATGRRWHAPREPRRGGSLVATSVRAWRRVRACQGRRPVRLVVRPSARPSRVGQAVCPKPAPSASRLVEAEHGKCRFLAPGGRGWLALGESRRRRTEAAHAGPAERLGTAFGTARRPGVTVARPPEQVPLAARRRPSRDVRWRRCHG